MSEWHVEPREKWAIAQLVHAGLSEDSNAVVQRLLRVYYESVFSIAERDELLNAFIELAKDRALEKPEQEWTWTPVRPGQIKVADTVRIKLGAYTGDIGKLHNGRLCKVVAIRSGDIIVNTIDEGPKFEGVHHSPFALDKRIPKT